MQYKIDLTALEKAHNSLKEIIERYKNESNDLAIRDAVIQRFEYTYSLALKMIRRYLELSLDESLAIDGMDFNAIIRKSSEIGLILNDLEKWTGFRLARNMTSHTYDEKKAVEVVSFIPAFEKEVDFLLKELKKRTEK
jgi:nucleotidyltransferase substrate binding protein (TIGR01987 family)